MSRCIAGGIASRILIALQLFGLRSLIQAVDTANCVHCNVSMSVGRDPPSRYDRRSSQQGSKPMKASEFCNREVVVVVREATIADAARLMRELHVGSVIVVDADEDCKRPVGILTDRDIVVEFMATDSSPDDVIVGDAMSDKLITVDESAELFETIELMRSHGVRRIPVVDDRDCLVGLVTSDDAVELIAEELTDLVKLIALQQRSEARRRG